MQITEYDFFYSSGPVPEERYSVLVNLAKKITDWKASEHATAGNEEDIGDTYGINVQFDQPDDEVSIFCKDCFPIVWFQSLPSSD